MLMDALGQAGCRHMGRTVAAYEARAGNLATLDDGFAGHVRYALSAVGLTARTMAREGRAGGRQWHHRRRLLRASDPRIFAVGDCARTREASNFHRALPGADPGAGRHPDRHRDAAAAACPARHGRTPARFRWWCALPPWWAPMGPGNWTWRRRGRPRSSRLPAGGDFALAGANLPATARWQCTHADLLPAQAPPI